MIDTVFTLSELLIKAAKAADQAYYDSIDGELEAMELTTEQKLEAMNVDNITSCYQSTSIEGFNIKNTEHILKQNYTGKVFDIQYIIVRRNCAYVKVVHSIPFNEGNKCYGASFSINFMEPNNGVAVYGYPTKNANEKQAFKEIAKELLKALV